MCNSGYKCTYYATKSGNFQITLTPDAQQDDGGLLALIAQAVGVDPSKLTILSVG